jgi:hypothetical protein
MAGPTRVSGCRVIWCGRWGVPMSAMGRSADACRAPGSNSFNPGPDGPAGWWTGRRRGGVARGCRPSAWWLGGYVAGWWTGRRCGDWVAAWVERSPDILLTQLGLNDNGAA